MFRTARNNADLEHVLFGEVHVFLGVGFAIAVRHGDTAPLTGGDRSRGRSYSSTARRGGVGRFSTRSSMIYEPVVEEIETDIEAVEHTIFASHADATERIHELKQEVNDLYRAVHPLLVPLEAMEHGAFAEMDPGLLRYFRDISDHLRRIHDEVLARREQLNSAFEANAALISVRQNEISARQNETVKQLTIVATVFLPLSFVVGFFGQNFGWLVQHINSLGAFIALGLGSLVCSGAALWLWLRRAQK